MPGGSIGSANFIELSGDLSKQSVALEEITRPGVNGVAFKQMGIRGRPRELFGVVDVTSSSAANNLRTTYEAIVGTVVTVTHRGQNLGNMLVLDVEITDRKAHVSAVGGESGGNWLVRSKWTVIYASI